MTLVSHPERQRITQVFASGIDLRRHRDMTEQSGDFIQISVEAAIVNAAKNGAEKIWIPFLGGGVFQNSLSHTAAGIVKAWRRIRGKARIAIILNDFQLNPNAAPSKAMTEVIWMLKEAAGENFKEIVVSAQK
jgi:O-acetyl-ADP-ribose deacetylase (regulator of RNase III)